MTWVRRIVLALAVLVLGTAAIVYGGSEWMLQRSHTVPAVQVTVPTDAAAIAEGERLATLVGCKSCHGNGKGAVWTPVDRMFGQIAPPPIARSIAGWSDADLARLIRHGVRRDGRAVFVMPTRSMRYLADDDLGRVIAWVRTLRPASDDVTERTWFGPLGRWQMLTGNLPSGVEAKPVAERRRPADPGRYFTQALCSECHDLHENRSHGADAVPPLATAGAAYPLEDFRQLLKTGLAPGHRDLGMMTVIARENLFALRDSEIASIHAYLVSEADK